MRLIAEEQIAKAKEKGILIENPAAFIRHKLQLVERQAAEDPGWLIRQRDRLLGPTRPRLDQRICKTCGANLGNVAFTVDGVDYCDDDCATGTTDHLISLGEYMRRLKAKGQISFTRHDGTTAVVTYDQVAGRAPEYLLRELDDEAEDSFI